MVPWQANEWDKCVKQTTNCGPANESLSSHYQPFYNIVGRTCPGVHLFFLKVSFQSQQSIVKALDQYNIEYMYRYGVMRLFSVNGLRDPIHCQQILVCQLYSQ